MFPFLLRQLHQWKESGLLAFVYSLLAELLILLYSLFAGLFTLEIFLPGFVSVRLNLALYFSVLVLLSVVLVVLGRFLSVSFPVNQRWERRLSFLGGMWFIGVLSVALLGFSWWIFFVLLALLLALFWCFRSLFLGASH